VSITLEAKFLYIISLILSKEYQKNPAELGARDWTPLARWKFREFNELNHLFTRRLTMAYPYSDQYLNQFPNDRLGQVAQFVVFITGGLGAVLALVSLLDPELFLGFEINGRTVLFWLGALGVVWKVARGLVPPDDIVFDPEMWLHQVMEHTHYCPKTWENRFHTDEVRQEFSTFYKLELVLFFEEVASVILTPFVFIFCLPRCAAQLVDFYREFTIHVDGLGHVCSYAVFDFKRGGEPNHRLGHNSNDLRTDYWAAKDNKLAESYQTFMLDYADAPRKGLRPPRNKRQFHLPPSFPGLAASRVHPGLGQSAHHTPRFEPARTAHAPSPMHSVLLDPHHQPRHSPRQGPQARFRGATASRHQILDADPDEHDEELPGPPARTLPQRTPSQIIEEDSELGDSWAIKADTENDNGGVNEGQGVPEGDAVGVLGLLYQFQKAQTEGRGINI
jgi:autophagy-related protein 9